MAYGIPDYMDPGPAPQQTPQRAQMNPVLSALAKGLVSGQGQKGNGLAAQALKKAFAQPGGDGLTVPASGGVGTGDGITPAASLAGQGAAISAAPAALSSSPLADQAAGNVSPDFSAGGYLDQSGRAVDTGFGDTGLGGGLRASDTGPGLQQGNSGFGYDATANNGAGEMTLNGKSSNTSGGSWGSAVTGALAGAGAGVNNYYKDPNMRNQKDGFGVHHADYRATIGGGTVGGLMGYYGGSLGSMAAPMVVDAIHPTMERLTRTMINTGDKLGDSAGAYVADPIGTVASGKYSNEQLLQDKIKYSLLGGLGKFV